MRVGNRVRYSKKLLARFEPPSLNTLQARVGEIIQITKVTPKHIFATVEWDGTMVIGQVHLKDLVKCS